MADFELRIETDTDEKVARLKLFGADGSNAGSNEISLPKHSSALWEGLFDARRCKGNSTGWWRRLTRRRVEGNLTRRHKATKEED